MQIRPYLEKWFVISLASVVFPPLGLVLVWIRRQTRLMRKIVCSLLILVIGVFYLRFLFGLRIETDGTGISPLISFYKRERHYARLEESRAHQKQMAPSPATEGIQAQPTPAEPEMPNPGHSPLSLSEIPAAERITKTPGNAHNYWTDFRGPRRDGRYDEMPVLNEWPSHGPILLWRQPIGGGYASFVVAEGKAFTIEQRRSQEVVSAYELKTGRELWAHAWDGEFRESMGGDGPRATPTWEGGRVYALGALGELRCLDANTGKLIWNKNILADNQAQNLTWGMAASPLVIDNKVIVLPGGPSGKSVVAYDKLTGEPIWKVLDDKQAYTSPTLVTLNGRRQLLVVSAQRAMGLDPEAGSLLWEFPWSTEYGINSAQPLIVNEDSFFISAGYGHGSAVVEVKPVSSGFAARPVWQNTSMKNKFGSSVLYQGHIYGMDEAILSCIDATSGERKWKGGRYGYGQLLLAGGSLIILSEYGQLALVKAIPEKYLEVSGFPALEGKTWNNPAIAEGYLLVRNTTEMACFRIAP